MEILVGKMAGFCYGVNNAVTKTIEYLEKSNKKLYCLGEIVHNKQVVKELEEKGVTFIDDVEHIIDLNKENKDITVVIRAHGEPKSTYDLLEKNNIEILDLTCPSVLKIHKTVEEYVNMGYYIFLIGQKNHPETIGTYGFCKGKCSIIENIEDIDLSIKYVTENNFKKVLIVAQTTFSLEKFNKFINKIKEFVNKYNAVEKTNNPMELEIKNTICNATKLRQEETNEISKQVEYMIIIGGKNSSNTKKLYDVSKENCNNVILIETYKELQNDDLIDKLKKSQKVGIMAGASTPKKSIDDVINILKK